MSFETDWQRCAPWLAAALEHAGGTHGLDDVEAAVRAGLMQFWATGRAVVVTELHRYPRLKACRVFAAAGDLDEIWRIEARILAWARREGCSRMEGCGRMGWKKTAERHGYRDPHIWMWKEI